MVHTCTVQRHGQCAYEMRTAAAMYVCYADMLSLTILVSAGGVFQVCLNLAAGRTACLPTRCVHLSSISLLFTAGMNAQRADPSK
jgi:hypothetical protein